MLFLLKRLFIGVLASIGASSLLAGAFGWWGVLPALFVGFWIGDELFAEQRGGRE